MTVQKRIYQSERQLSRQARILDVARSELTTSGYQGLTMRGLADKAGVARKTLYNLYSSKDELVLAAVGEVLNDITETVEREHHAPGIPTILAFQREASRQTVRIPVYAQAMTHALFQAKPGHILVQALLDNTRIHHAQHLQRAHHQGELRARTSVDTLARHLAGQSWGVILLWVKGLLRLEDLEHETQRSMLLTLIAATQGKRQRYLEKLLAQLPNSATVSARTEED